MTKEEKNEMYAKHYGAKNVNQPVMTKVLHEEFDTLQKALHESSKAHGFWEGPEQSNIPTKLMLIVSEIAEAMEAHRSSSKGTGPVMSQKIPNYTLFAEELADAVIRIADLAEHEKIDLMSAIMYKANYNMSRTFRHGNKNY